MEPPTIKTGKGPEYYIQQAIIKYLEARGWHVLVTHGNMYQQGLPDLLACHKDFGHRWIEVKNLDAFSFTPAQRRWFPLMDKGAQPMKIWILVAATEDEYRKLFQEPNWYIYMYGTVSGRKGEKRQ